MTPLTTRACVARTRLQPGPSAEKPRRPGEAALCYRGSGKWGRDRRRMCVVYDRDGLATHASVELIDAVLNGWKKVSMSAMVHVDRVPSRRRVWRRSIRWRRCMQRSAGRVCQYCSVRIVNIGQRELDGERQQAQRYKQRRYAPAPGVSCVAGSHVQGQCNTGER